MIGKISTISKNEFKNVLLQTGFWGVCQFPDGTVQVQSTAITGTQYNTSQSGQTRSNLKGLEFASAAIRSFAPNLLMRPWIPSKGTFYLKMTRLIIFRIFPY